MDLAAHFGADAGVVARCFQSSAGGRGEEGQDFGKGANYGADNAGGGGEGHSIIISSSSRNKSQRGCWWYSGPWYGQPTPPPPGVGAGAASTGGK